MRRILAVAFLSALSVLVPQVFAQSGGHPGGFSGHAGAFGGGHPGGSFGHSFGGGFSGGSFGRSAGFAPRSFATAPRFNSTAPSRAFAPGNRMNYSGGTAQWRHDRRGDHGRNDHYRSPYRGYGYGGYPYAYANSWELLPWDAGSSDFTGDNGYDTGADTQQQPAASVAPPDDGYRPGYEQPPDQPYQYSSAPVAAANSAAVEPELTLIFNDGHRETIRNYVLTSDMVIVLDQAASGYQKRIPLAALDLPATEQAAQQAGLDFSPPA